MSTLPIKGNYEIKIVLSGSMEPAIKVGSIVIIKPADTYEIGDIITFGKDDRDNVPTTHRIVEMRVIEGELRFMTKGDANDDSDFREVTENQIIGKVLLDIPWLGFLLDTAKKPLGFAILIGIPALAIVADEVKKIWKEVKKIKGKKESFDAAQDEESFDAAQDDSGSTSLTTGVESESKDSNNGEKV